MGWGGWVLLLLLLQSVDSSDKLQLFGLTAGFLTFARLVVPLRIALALALTPAMDKYVVKGLLNKNEASADAAEVRVHNPTRRSTTIMNVYQDRLRIHLSDCVLCSLYHTFFDMFLSAKTATSQTWAHYFGTGYPTVTTKFQLLTKLKQHNDCCCREHLNTDGDIYSCITLTDLP